MLRQRAQFRAFLGMCNCQLFFIPSRVRLVIRSIKNKLTHSGRVDSTILFSLGEPFSYLGHRVNFMYISKIFFQQTVASYQGLHCLPTSYSRDAKLKWIPDLCPLSYFNNLMHTIQHVQNE